MAILSGTLLGIGKLCVNFDSLLGEMGAKFSILSMSGPAVNNFCFTVSMESISIMGEATLVGVRMNRQGEMDVIALFSVALCGLIAIMGDGVPEQEMMM
jgi:hypothetical protein